MTFFTDLNAWNIFFTGESQCVSTPWIIFLTHARSSKPMFCSFGKHFLTETSFYIYIGNLFYLVYETFFSLHIIHSLVNFI